MERLSAQGILIGSPDRGIGIGENLPLLEPFRHRVKVVAKHIAHVGREVVDFHQCGGYLEDKEKQEKVEKIVPAVAEVAGKSLEMP